MQVKDLKMAPLPGTLLSRPNYGDVRTYGIVVDDILGLREAAKAGQKNIYVRLYNGDWTIVSWVDDPIALEQLNHFSITSRDVGIGPREIVIALNAAQLYGWMGRPTIEPDCMVIIDSPFSSEIGNISLVNHDYVVEWEPATEQISERDMRIPLTFKFDNFDTEWSEKNDTARNYRDPNLNNGKDLPKFLRPKRA